MFSVKRLTDGRAEFEREVLNLEDLRATVAGTYNIIKSRLSAVYVKLSPLDTAYATKLFSLSVSTGVGTDPVTNT
jgi:hypothetical protein